MQKININNKKEQDNKKGMVRLIKKTIVSEKQNKWEDNYTGSITVVNAFQFFDVTSLIVQGVAVNNRVGATILLKRVRMAGSWVTGDATQLCRLIAFKWIPSNSSDVPNTAELITGSGAQSTISGFLQYKPSRFQILYDHTWHLDTLAHPIKSFSFYVDVNSRVEYDIGVNTGRNHIYFAYVSDSGVVPNPVLNFSCQTQFVDLD